ncbi:MAG: ATP synthase F1 subunit epsilon [Pseudomonadota bacterium]
MAAGTFQFELVSPEKMLLSEPAEQVTMSGTEGDFTVLAGHAPVVATLLPCVINVKLPSGSQAIYVRGGFAEVTPDTCSVLVESAFVTDGVDRDLVERELAEAQKSLDAAEDDEARVHLTRAIESLKSIEASARS